MSERMDKHNQFEDKLAMNGGRSNKDRFDRKSTLNTSKLLLQ